jgi:EAL and modified HD-GYP domain-containing signal transduction protein
MKTFLARQPMFDRNSNVVSYELLFRSSNQNQAFVNDDYTATMKVMKDLIVNFGIKEMTNHKRFFINFNADLIMDKAPDLFKSDELVIEILEDTLANTDLLDVLTDYKEQGYVIALDDFEYSDEKIELIKLADIIKLDFMISSYDELREIVKAVTPYGVDLLAEKIETEEDYNLAVELGCSLFQGYYYQKPTVFESSETTTIPSVYYELLDEINNEVVDYNNLGRIIKQDTSLTVSILKLLNSAAYYSRNKVTSVKRALVNLGVKSSKNLIMMNMLKSISSAGSPEEIINISLKRGKEAERFAEYFGMKHRKDELFIYGLLSLIDVIMKRDMKSILHDVPLEDDVIDALLGQENELSKVLELIIAHEKDDILKVQDILIGNNIDIKDFMTIYIESTKWADNIWKKD